MTVTILHIDECPNWREAGERVREALDVLGHHEIGIEFALLVTPQDAARVPFAGSPTILVDGEDLFPTDGRAPELACRVYVTESGLAGLPSRAQLEAALRARLPGGDPAPPS